MKNSPADEKWDRRLNIETASASFEKDDKNHSRYEPTSYAVLERIKNSGLLDENSIAVDYGCGKGRVGFYLHAALGIRTVGVEFNPEIHQCALRNLSRYTGKHRKNAPVFRLADAESYPVTEETVFYFFNPFSQLLLKSVLRRIFDSYYENPRRMLLLFYYPVDSYLSLLYSEARLMQEAEIDVSDLFDNADPREKILVFRVE